MSGWTQQRRLGFDGYTPTCCSSGLIWRLMLNTEGQRCWRWSRGDGYLVRGRQGYLLGRTPGGLQSHCKNLYQTALYRNVFGGLTKSLLQGRFLGRPRLQSYVKPRAGCDAISLADALSFTRQNSVIKAVGSHILLEYSMSSMSLPFLAISLVSRLRHPGQRGTMITGDQNS